MLLFNIKLKINTARLCSCDPKLKKTELILSMNSQGRQDFTFSPKSLQEGFY